MINRRKEGRKKASSLTSFSSCAVLVAPGHSFRVSTRYWMTFRFSEPIVNGGAYDLIIPFPCELRAWKRQVWGEGSELLRVISLASGVSPKSTCRMQRV